MKNSDLIATVLKDVGVKDFFAVTGGAAINIIDSLVVTGGMKPYFHHHEQAAALAADSYARLKGLGLCVVTTGPGVTNSLTGLLCSWQDSVPCIYISGQARLSQTDQNTGVRQAGTQHLEVLPIIRNLTKKSWLLNEKDNIEEVLYDLISVSTTGRKGPVWLDIPLDVQLKFNQNYSNAIATKPTKQLDIDLSSITSDLIDQLSESSKPIMVLGRGLVGLKQSTLTKLVGKLNIPVLKTWGFHDTNLEIPKFHDFGFIGVSGQRGANFLVSQADLIISIGVRWGQAVVGPNIENFAPQAKVIIIDIDEKELNRIPRKLNFTLKQCNALSLLQFLMKNDIPNLPINQNWLDYCNKIANYNHEQLFSNSSESIDQYQFISLIQKLVTIPTIFVIDGGGTIVYCSMQTLQKSNLVQVVIPSASCPMGTGIPQSIGAQIANKNNLVVTIIGDGSFTFNLQELQTIQTYKLPIKIIILNNDGYLSIKETQSKFQNSRFLGSDKCGGLELPSVAAIANAFGIKYRYIERYSDINNIFLEVFSSEKAEIIEVKIRHDQKIFPTLGFEKNTKGEFLTLPLSIMEPRINLPKFQ